MSFKCAMTAISMAVLFSASAHAVAPVSDVYGDGSQGDSYAVPASSNDVYAAPAASSYTASTSALAMTATGTLEERLATLERTFNGRLRLQAELQQQVDGLQGEVAELRGQIEQQNYQLKQAQDRQRELYQQIDQLSRAAPVVASSPVGRPANSAVSSAVAPAGAAPSAASATPAGDETSAYNSAIKLLLETKDYNQALPAFEAFLVQYPQSTYVPNVHYWLGQLLFLKGQRAEAKQQFTTLVERYPQAAKRGDGLLKLGTLALSEGNTAQAKSFFQQVLQNYPSSAAAQLAKQELNKL
ncbi:MAG: tol-pal system protein YbgF [Aeromonas sp.]